MPVGDRERALEHPEAVGEPPGDERMPAIGLGGARPQQLVADGIRDLHRALRRLDAGPDAQPVRECGRDADLEVAERAARLAAREHAAGGVEVAERADDVEVLGIDRVHQRSRHAEAGVDTRGAVAVAEPVVQRQRLLEVADLAADVADHDHEVAERDQQVRAPALAALRSRQHRDRTVPVLGGVVPREQRRGPPAGLERVRDGALGVAGRPGEAEVERQRGDLAVARCPLDRRGRPGMQPPSPGAARAGVERLADERVGERVRGLVAAVELHDELSAAGLLERLDQLVLGHVDGREQDRELALAAEHRGGHEHRPRPVRKPPEPPHEHLLDGVGNADLV